MYIYNLEERILVCVKTTIHLIHFILLIVQKTSCYNIVKSEKLKYDAIMSRLIEGGIGSVLGVFGIPLLQMKTN